MYWTDFLRAGGGCLVTHMKSIGFREKRGSPPAFVRMEGELAQVIRPLLMEHHVEIQVFIWVPELHDRRLTLRTVGAQEMLAFTGGILGRKGLDTGQTKWKFSNLEKCPQVCEQLRRAIDQHALSWFANVRTKKDIAKEIRPEFRITFGESNTVYDRIIRKLTRDDLAGVERAIREFDNKILHRRLVSRGFRLSEPWTYFLESTPIAIAFQVTDDAKSIVCQTVCEPDEAGSGYLGRDGSVSKHPILWSARAGEARSTIFELISAIDMLRMRQDRKSK